MHWPSYLRSVLTVITFPLQWVSTSTETYRKPKTTVNSRRRERNTNHMTNNSITMFFKRAHTAHGNKHWTTFYRFTRTTIDNSKARSIHFLCRPGSVVKITQRIRKQLARSTQQSVCQHKYEFLKALGTRTISVRDVKDSAWSFVLLPLNSKCSVQDFPLIWIVHGLRKSMPSNKIWDSNIVVMVQFILH